MSVDIQNGETVTFDTYPTSNGLRVSKYEHMNEKYAIRYDHGISWEHFRTSAAAPGIIQYPTLEDAY